MTKAACLLAAVLIGFPTHGVQAQDRWLELDSDHYRLVGNVDGNDLEQVAARFEAFHSALSEMFSPRQYPDLGSTTVVVFNDDDGLEELGLTGSDAFFLGDEGENYVAMRTESNGRRPFDGLLHGYFHAVAEDTIPNAPFWLKEGLAHLYRSVTWSPDGNQLQIGRPIESFVRRVRDDDALLSFDELFAARNDGASYDESDTDNIYHAQSWALMHYLITLNEGQGYAQAIRFVRLMADGEAFEDAAEDAYGVSFRTVLAGFENNVQERGTYPYLTLATADSSRGLGAAAPQVLSPSEVEVHLGALLMRRGATDQAEARFRQAVRMDPNAVTPKVALARFLIAEGRFPEARLALESAVSGASGSDAFSHYYYALALLGDGSQADSGALSAARSALRNAIRLDAELADAYHELALTHLAPGQASAANEGLEEAAALIDKALELKPQNAEYRFSLGRILIEQDRFSDARTALFPLVDEIQPLENRDRARSILQSIEGLEGRSGVQGDGFTEITRAEPTPNSIESAGVAPSDLAAPDLGFERFELTRVVNGQQVSGELSLIDCREGLTLTVEADSNIYLFHTDTPDRVEFATFTSEVGSELGCGPLEPPVAVVITFQQAPDGSEFIGVPNKVEFVAAP